MIATYESTQEKDWIEATVTVDGMTYDDVGLRLKGFSTLYDAAVAELTESLFEGGAAETIVERLVASLATQDIVDAAVVDAEAAALLQTIRAI